MPTYFVNGKVLLIKHNNYKESDKLQNRCNLLLIAIVTVAIHHMCSVANKEWAHDVDLLCIACIHWYECAHQNRMQQCMCMLDFEVLHMVNMQARACTHTCVKFKFSRTVTILA